MIRNFSFKNLFRSLLMASLGLTTSCQQSLLNVQTQYLSPESLASFYVNTPDPCRDNPDIGERLLISWSLPKNCMVCHCWELVMRVRFKNHEEEEKTLELTEEDGSIFYCLVNEDFLEKQGIVAYQIELRVDGESAECWTHPLWARLIVMHIEEDIQHSCELIDNE